ncbi:MAG TPA: hypothetical protein VHM25_21315 [Polyangiaceae bacterium]|jgi:hypothetical protein|nr:hypothetical protein [Polyangiaceae bacterium]
MSGDLVTREQVRRIERACRVLGVYPDSEGVRIATALVGGSRAPYGYLLLTRDQYERRRRQERGDGADG